MLNTTLQRSATGIVVLGIALLGASVFANQQTPPATQATAAVHQHDHQAKPDEAKATAMMAKHKEMMADISAMDSRLNDLVAKMKAATGAAKIQAIEAVVSELATQRSAMRDRAMMMQSGMAGHMMEHMEAGGMAAGCPMMSKAAKK